MINILKNLEIKVREEEKMGNSKKINLYIAVIVCVLILIGIALFCLFIIKQNKIVLEGKFVFYPGDVSYEFKSNGQVSRIRKYYRRTWQIYDYIKW